MRLTWLVSTEKLVCILIFPHVTHTQKIKTRVHTPTCPTWPHTSGKTSLSNTKLHNSTAKQNRSHQIGCDFSGLPGPDAPRPWSPGATGSTGATGAPGYQGATGFPGMPGPRGFQGPAGPMGPIGPRGMQGSVGSTGNVLQRRAQWKHFLERSTNC